MKIIIIYASFHHKNTEKIAQIIGSVLDAKIVEFSQAKIEEIKEADLIGFGSGVYFSKFHRGLINLVNKLPKSKKKAFLFSTSGIKKNIILNRSHNHFKKILKQKGIKTIGEFNCLAFDNYGILKIFGGINKGKPNEKDFIRAKKFAQEIIKWK